LTVLNLIIDIGNNSAKFFLFKGEQLILHTRKSNSSFDVIDEWNRLYNIEKAIISSVIVETPELSEAISGLQCPIVRFSNSMYLPLEINYRTPHTLGSDRIAAAVGAWNEAPGRNMLVIDAGSAITIDFVGKDGKYNGGNITPGIKMRLKALHEYTSRLPMVEKDGDTPTMGYDTETAIRSGVINGICHEIEGYINEFKQKYCDVLVFLTGGDEKPLKNRIKSCIFADKYLVAKGLNRILLDYGNE
jgi:type III pantothenate kinase